MHRRHSPRCCAVSGVTVKYIGQRLQLRAEIMCVALQTREKEGGKVLSVLTDKRSHVWRFVRGPLSAVSLPARELDLQWKVLDIVR